MDYRILDRNDIVKLKEIDNSEVVHYNYRLEKGKLEVFEFYCEIPRFSEENLKSKLDNLFKLYDRGGTIFGAFDKDNLIGLASLDSVFRGSAKDKLQLALLHVDKNHRKRGIGRHLMELSIEKAKEIGAKKLYISGSPKKNTIDFYKRMGSYITTEIEKDLYDLEPEDIHMELVL